LACIREGHPKESPALDSEYLHPIHDAATVAPGQAAFLLGTEPDGTPLEIDWTLPAPRTGGRIGVVYYATELPASPCLQLVEGPTL
jgi:hypothetical protein